MFWQQNLYVDEDYLNRVEQELVKLIEENKVERVYDDILILNSHPTCSY